MRDETDQLEKGSQFIDVDTEDVTESVNNYCSKYCRPSTSCGKQFLEARLPCIRWIRRYNAKSDLIKDLIAGFTIGIIQVPQAMAYSQTAGLPAAHGLYVTFFHCIVYLLLGTSRHLSPGTYAIISLMVISATDKYEGVLFASQAANSTIGDRFVATGPNEARVVISTALSMASGLMLVMAGVLRLGFVSRFLSDAVVSGLSVGAVFQVIVSQIKVLLGIRLDSFSTPFVVIGTVFEIVKHIYETNMMCLCISVVSIVVLFAFKILNETHARRLPAPIPIEVTVVMLATGLSSLVGLASNWEVPVVGPLPLGLPSVSVPPLSLLWTLMGDAASIATLTFALQISFAKLYSNKHSYEIAPNQELLAYGTCNVVASFFNGYPGCVALSRCIIADNIGVRSQLVSGISALIVLATIMLLGPFVAPLPNCVLASLIVVALLKKVLDVADFPVMWRRSKLDALAWLFTFLGVVVMDVAKGLYFGLIATLLLSIFKSQRPHCASLGHIKGTTVFESTRTCPNAKEYPETKIVRYEESLYYANVDDFKSKIIKLVGVRPSDVMLNIKNECQNEFAKIKETSLKQKQLTDAGPSVKSFDMDNYVLSEGLVDVVESEKAIKMSVRARHLAKFDLKHIILDASCINYVDTQGSQALLWLCEQFRSIHVAVYLSHAKSTVRRQLIRNNCRLECPGIQCFFATTHDAFIYIQNKDSECSDHMTRI